MDSGNSGSISSSGDEEYESRSDHNHQSIPSFLNPSLTHFGSTDQNPPTDPSQLLSHHHNHLFDPSRSSSNYLQHQHTPNPNTNFFLNLDATTVRSRSPLMRSDHNQQPYNLGLMNNNPTNSVSSILGSHNHFQGSSSIHQPQQPTQVLPSEPGSSIAAGAQRSVGSSGQTAVARSSKKRTRASRRAPTTVLTTDTSNFRAMVQEFTGIPAPPFSASSPFSRRFDLFGAGSSGIRSGLEGPLYPNLVRPSAMKPHQTTPFIGNVGSTSSSPHNVTIDGGNIATSSVSYAQPSDLMMSKGAMRNVLGMQNQSLNMAFQVQSLPTLQPHHSSLNVGSGFGGANKLSQPSLALDGHHHHNHGHHHHQEHLNVGHGYGGPAQAQVCGSDSAPASQTVWRGDGTSGSGDMSCKMNYTTSAANSSQFHGEKTGLEINVSTRGEGTVDSWIFPSD